MTPAEITEAVLTALRLGGALLPGEARSIVASVIDALDELPDLVEEMGDGVWSEDDTRALQVAIVRMLAPVPALAMWHRRGLAHGAAALVDLIRAQVLAVPPTDRTTRRQRAKATLADARHGIGPVRGEP